MMGRSRSSSTARRERDAGRAPRDTRSVSGPPEPPRSETPSDEGEDPVFDTLWQRVRDAWEDDKAHASLVEYALRAGKLPEVAGRYRALMDQSEKTARAKRQLDAIVLAATQMMLAMKTPPRTKPPTAITLSALALCAALLGLLAYAL